jgi:protein-S-isoprenylcysteine O-methyltransferase Ste14
LNAAYAVIQTLLLGIFAVVVVFGPKVWLLPSNAILAIAGDGACAAGLLLLLIALGQIGRSVQIAPAPREDGRLVTSGVYAWLRHPMYTAILLVIVGFFFRTPTLAVGIAGAIVIAFLVIKTRFEERLLLARYPEYARYKSRTWGIVPWPRRPS